MKINEELLGLVLGIVGKIPYGKVVTYKDIARLSKVSNPRIIGKILAWSIIYGNHPCHRAVNAKSRLASNFAKQKELLLKEGVEFSDNNLVDMKKYHILGI